jgi:hypothetical protein
VTEEVAISEDEEDAPPKRPGLFGGAMFAAAPSPMPPLGRTIARGALAVAGQPVIVATTVVVVALWWLGLVVLGFEGTPGRLVAVLALPPISTFFDLGTGNAIYGISPGLLFFLGGTLVVRTIVVSVLVGMVLGSLEDGRVSKNGVLRAARALPTVLVVHVICFSAVIAGNMILPVLGPAFGFFGLAALLVGALFFLGFAPAAAVREGRPVLDEIRRSGRAATLPNARHLVLCVLYFFVAMTPLFGLGPGHTEMTANPSVATWVFAFLMNVVHVAFIGALTYRWLAVEPSVPEEPVKRHAAKTPAKAPSAKARSRR